MRPVSVGRCCHTSKGTVRVGAALTLALLLHALGLRPPRALASRMASLISELAFHEVPGFGAPALPPGLGLEALASALAIARDHGVSHRPAVAIPASAATATCWHTKC